MYHEGPVKWNPESPEPRLEAGGAGADPGRPQDLCGDSATPGKRPQLQEKHSLGREREVQSFPQRVQLPATLSSPRAPTAPRRRRR